MHTQTGKELTYDQYSALFLSDSTNYDSHFNPMSSKTSRQVYNTEIGDNNFDQDLPSDVTEDSDYDIEASATTLLAHIWLIEKWITPIVIYI